MKPSEEAIEHWIKLSTTGATSEAADYYDQYLFPAVINQFQEYYSQPRENELLVSLLGFSPEPVILTAKAVQPASHVIVTTQGKQAEADKISNYLGSGFRTVTLENIEFSTIYAALKEALYQHPTDHITIDITGGKKSMVAAASIFGKDYGCRIVYVDFSEYLQQLRKPRPGTEQLMVVYDPDQHQPELTLD